MVLFPIFYDIALFFVLIGFFPVAFKNYLLHGKYQGFFKKRGGGEFSKITRSEGPLVWIHAVSVGETRAVQRIAKLLKEKNPKLTLLITSITDTGHEEAKRALPFADHHLYLPLDFSFLIRPIVRRLKPDLVLFSETDYWYQFATAAKNEGAKIAIVNAKISDRSYRRLRPFKYFLKDFFHPVDLVLSQNNEYQTKWIELGIGKKHFVTGNLKLDAEDMKKDPTTKIPFLENSLILTAGSTHRGEEELILTVYSRLKESIPDLKLILVPRHPERFNEVKSLLKTRNENASCFSELKETSRSFDILLMDSMGSLRECYRISSLAVVCGSFIKGVGGHNLLEPTPFGIPVLFGPHTENQKELASLAEQFQTGFRVDSDTLYHKALSLLKNLKERETIKKHSLALQQHLEGRSALALKFLKEESLF